MSAKLKREHDMKRRRTAISRGRGGRGFTLIELLVVLAIISLLVAVLLPSLGRVRSRARLIRCGSNVRSLATAWIAYLNDHQGRFYQRPNANVNYGGWRGLKDEKGWWPRPLNPWVGLPDPNGITEHTAAVFHCPADRGGIPDSYFLEKVYRAHGTSYQTNPFLIGPDNCKSYSDRTRELDLAIAARLPHLNMTRAASHTRLVLIGDYGWVNQWDPAPFLYPQWKEQAEWHGSADHHSVAFLDGRVAFTEIKKGIYVTSEYCVLPFQDLYSLATQVQGPAE
jgi:prepilin-type N-terminal cleavage/methylation domain-containing protein